MVSSCNQVYPEAAIAVSVRLQLYTSFFVRGRKSKSLSHNPVGLFRSCFMARVAEYNSTPPPVCPIVPMSPPILFPHASVPQSPGKALAHAIFLWLYPISFFFSFLLYTDPGGTFFVLLCYLLATGRSRGGSWGRRLGSSIVSRTFFPSRHVNPIRNLLCSAISTNVMSGVLFAVHIQCHVISNVIFLIVEKSEAIAYLTLVSTQEEVLGCFSRLVGRSQRSFLLARSSKRFFCSKWSFSNWFPVSCFGTRIQATVTVTGSAYTSVASKICCLPWPS